METATSLRELSVKAVIAGSEPGVGLTDQLADCLSLQGNPVASSQSRWDKNCMYETLCKVGLNTCRQRRCSSLEEACSFAQELGEWPLVAKPCASTGSDQVYKCEDSDALAEAVQSIFLANNVSGHMNSSALVQRFLTGTEYIVDCVSIGGLHLVSAMWAKETAHGFGMFAQKRLAVVPFDDEEGCVQKQVREYVFKCLTACEVKNGASTSKVAYNKMSGPCLIKLSARMHGGFIPALWGNCAGNLQAQPYLVADVYCHGGQHVLQRIAEVAKGSPAYELSAHCVQVGLFCSQSGVLKRSIEHTSGKWIAKLPSFWASRFHVEDGDRIDATFNGTSSPGYVVLVGSDAESVESDELKIREAERDGSVYIVRQDERSESAPPRKLIKLTGSPYLRPMEAQASKLLSPLTSVANSPQLVATADCPFVDEFMLDGFDGFMDESGLV